MSKAKPVPAPVVTAPATEHAQPAADALQQPSAPPEPVRPQPAPVEPLDDFLRRVECAHIARDVYAVAATHPAASTRVWPGTYSGIRLSPGDVSVTYSDGSTE